MNEELKYYCCPLRLQETISHMVNGLLSGSMSYDGNKISIISPTHTHTHTHTTIPSPLAVVMGLVSLVALPSDDELRLVVRPLTGSLEELGRRVMPGAGGFGDFEEGAGGAGCEEVRLRSGTRIFGIPATPKPPNNPSQLTHSRHRGETPKIHGCYTTYTHFNDLAEVSLYLSVPHDTHWLKI